MKPSLVAFTGAGISAESELATFRSGDGIRAKYDLHKVAAPRAFASDPPLVPSGYDAIEHINSRTIDRLFPFADFRLSKISPPI